MTASAPIADPSRCLTIADVARETGIQKDTLRVWEKRYGFPTPGRDAHGERTYDTQQLARLQLIKRLLDAGYRPGAVVAQPADWLAQTAQTRHPSPVVAAAAGQAGEADKATSARVEAADVLDGQPWLMWIQQSQTEMLQRALSQYVLCHGLVRTLDGLLAALGKAVGDAWFAGELSVVQEHLYAQTVQRFLQDALQTLARQVPDGQRPPRVLLTTLPGEQHTLGLLMAECVLAMEGCQRFSLGRDTPLADLVRAATELELDVLAIGVSPHASHTAIWSGLLALDQQLPAQVELWVGGSSRFLRRRAQPSRLRCLSGVGALSAEVARWRRTREI